MLFDQFNQYVLYSLLVPLNWNSLKLSVMIKEANTISNELGKNTVFCRWVSEWIYTSMVGMLEVHRTVFLVTAFCYIEHDISLFSTRFSVVCSLAMLVWSVFFIETLNVYIRRLILDHMCFGGESHDISVHHALFCLLKQS